MKPDTSSIMRAVRERLGTPAANETVAAPVDLPVPSPPAPARVAPADMGNNYALSDLTAPNDREFVTRAYRALLRRDPDADGLATHLAGLRSGRVDKIDVLASLRWSDEGRAQDVHVDGLLAPTMLRRWRRKPVVGRIVAAAHAIARLPVVLQRIERVEATLARDVVELAERFGLRSDQLEESNRRLAEGMARLGDRAGAAEAQAAAVAERLPRLEALVSTAGHEADGARARLAQAEERLLGLAAEFAGAREAIARMDVASSSSATRLDAIDERIDQAFAAASSREDELHFRITACQESIERLAALGQHVEKLVGDASTRLDGRIDQAFAAASAREDELHFAVTACQESIDRLAALGQHVEKLVGDASTRLDGRIDQAFTAASAREDELHFAVTACRESIERLATFEQELSALLESTSERLGRIENGELAHAGAPTTDGPLASLDALYVAFEARFRGEASLIRKRLEVYLPHIREANVGGHETPVIDVGSGNGEWLELLRDHDVAARGIDNNAVFVDLCRARGFEVTHADAIDALAAMPDESVGAVTAFHLAEHLPFTVLVSLIDHALRVLRPGGLLILETPNPENLLVGSCYFYTDPTHRNPLPPETLRWLVESRGFRRAQIQRLADWRDVGAPPPVDDSVQGAATINAMIERFAAAPDYAITARKL